MTKKTETIPGADTNLVDAYNAAVAAFEAAEATLRGALERADALEASLPQMQATADELDRQRGDALARGLMDDAAAIGRKWATAHDATRVAQREAAAIRGAVPDLEIALLDCEEAAQDAHRRVLTELHDRELDALIADLRPRVLRLYRAQVARGGGRTFDDWMLAIARALHPGSDFFQEPLADSLPVPEIRPQTTLFKPGSHHRNEIADRREAQRAA